MQIAKHVCLNCKEQVQSTRCPLSRRVGGQSALCSAGQLKNFANGPPPLPDFRRLAGSASAPPRYCALSAAAKKACFPLPLCLSSAADDDIGFLCDVTAAAAAAFPAKGQKPTNAPRSPQYRARPSFRHLGWLG